MDQEKTLASPQRKLALLIDGDNISAALLDKILDEANHHGQVTINRIYGDWTKNHMNGWRNSLHDCAARPIQQFQYTVGKNATDCALIIDAMDILYSKRVDGFCLAASDSDYTRLAIRIREEGLFMLGIGRAQTPRAFVNACDLFVFTKELGQTHDEKPPISEADNVVKTTASQNGSAPAETAVEKNPLQLLKTAFKNVVDDNGYTTLSRLASQTRIIDPRFDVRDYGHKQFSKLIKSYPEVFKMKFRNGRPITVKLLESTPSTNGTASHVESQHDLQPKNKEAEPLQNGETVNLLKQAFGRAVQEKGWINLQVIQSCLKQLDPTFAPEAHGHEELVELVKNYPDVFEVKSANGRNRGKTYIRVKALMVQ